MKLKRKLKKKYSGKTTADLKPDREKLKIIKTYPKEKCIIEGCKRNAVGKMDVCKRHGGDPVIPENLLLPEEMPNARMLATKYLPAVHPIQFITLSKQGKSDVEIAAAFQVSVGTLKAWSEKFIDFNTAYEVGQALQEAWWLQEGKENLDNRGYNTGLFKFLTGNKLGYSDKIESKNLNISAGVLLVPGQMNEKEWEKSVGKASEG